MPRAFCNARGVNVYYARVISHGCGSRWLGTRVALPVVVAHFRATPKENIMRLGQAERAVYEILEHGPMTPEKSALYRRTLTALVAAKLVKRREDGCHELVAPGNGPPLPRAESEPPPAPKETMQTVTVRVPAEYVTLLDSMGGTRSDALRTVLRQFAGSGTRKKAS